MPKFIKWVETVKKEPNAKGRAYTMKGVSNNGYLKQVWKNQSTDENA